MALERPGSVFLEVGVLETLKIAFRAAHAVFRQLSRLSHPALLFAGLLWCLS